MTPERFSNRREFLKISAASALATAGTSPVQLLAQSADKADYTLRIRRTNIELAPNHTVIDSNSTMRAMTFIRYTCTAIASS